MSTQLTGSAVPPKQTIMHYPNSHYPDCTYQVSPSREAAIDLYSKLDKIRDFFLIVPLTHTRKMLIALNGEVNVSDCNNKDKDTLHYLINGIYSLVS